MSSLLAFSAVRNKTASEKAECFLLKNTVNELSISEWRQLIAGIPDDVVREIGKLKSADKP